MKELSIQEKAKRYDEAKRRGLDYIRLTPATELVTRQSILEHIFPELKESEDEESKKWILEYLHDGLRKSDEQFKDHFKAAIAWLEKQSTPQVRTGLEWVNTIDDACDKRYSEEYAHGEYCHEQSFKWGFQEGVDWLESQGTQKPAEYTLEQAASIFLDALSNTPYNNKPITDAQVITKELLKFLEDTSSYNSNAINEQKTADKVEPKFKVGDWIVKGDVIAQILDVQEQYYVGLDTEGKDFTASRFLSNDKIHLWTIQDAKDGDVLTYNDSRNNVWVCIFKEYANERVYDYCTLDKEDFWERGNWNYLASFSYIPATKEQRDLLFLKMKEAGYEWDAEKKELRKIEQNPVWSEEDEKMFEHIIAKATLHFSSINYLDEEEINFLKSLKDRVQPQLKQEWSEEDDQYLLVCKNALRKYQVTDKWDSNIISQWLDNKLKYLRPQSTWKPSEEQMDALRYVTNFDYGGYKAALVSLYEQLKKLKA